MIRICSCIILSMSYDQEQNCTHARECNAHAHIAYYTYIWCMYVILHIGKRETADPSTAYEPQVLVMSQYRGGTAIMCGIMSNHFTSSLHHGCCGLSLGAGTPLTLEDRNVYSQGQGNITFHGHWPTLSIQSISNK